MGLSTIRKKLGEQQYPTAQKFFDDFKLMIRNCFLFNPAGTPVNQAGIELQRVFDEKWKQLPPLREVASEDDDEDKEDSEGERQREPYTYYTSFVNLTLCADSPRRYHRDDGKPDRDDAGEHCCTQKHETAQGEEEEERGTRQGTCCLFL
jgi:Bromodomain